MMIQLQYSFISQIYLYTDLIHYISLFNTSKIFDREINITIYIKYEYIHNKYFIENFFMIQK